MGWMNYFGRWFTTPVVRTWWPVLSPMYNRKAVQFAERHFGLPAITDLQPSVVEPVDDRGWRRPCGETWGDDAARQNPLRLLRYVAWRTGRRACGGFRDGWLVTRSAGGRATSSCRRACGPRASVALPEAAGTCPGNERIRPGRVEVSEPAVRDDAGRKEFSDLVQMYREAGFRQDAQTDSRPRLRRPAPRVVKMRRPLR